MQNGLCPKCGFKREVGAIECPRCGIIFEKYEQIKIIKAQSQEQIKSTIPTPIGKKKLEGCAVLLFFALLIPVLFSIFGNVTDSNSIDANTIEYKMASLDAGWQIDTDDPVINRYKYLLGSISAKTGESHERIADITVTGQRTLKDRFGKHIKLLNLLEQANTSMPGLKNTKLSYSETLSALIILIGQ